MSAKRKFWENIQYVVLVGLIIAQCVVGKSFYLGQGIYLIVNLIATLRSFILHRPNSDKTKDACCLAITVGIILFSLLTNSK